jgi:hypothetical protein
MALMRRGIVWSCIIHYGGFGSPDERGKYALYGPRFLPISPGQSRKTPINLSFRFLWRIRPNIALIGKIKAETPSPKARQRP